MESIDTPIRGTQDQGWEEWKSERDVLRVQLEASQVSELGLSGNLSRQEPWLRAAETEIGIKPGLG